MIVLGIESSCDDTAVSVLCITEGKGNFPQKVDVVSSHTHSQTDIHSEFGGVVPILAAREHEQNLPHVYAAALKSAKITENDIDLIAVTRGPGLSPALIRGLRFAKELSKNLGKPIIGANHMEGHIFSVFLHEQYRDDLFPALALIVSGGHTELVHVQGVGEYEYIGRTKDDAAGEAFDKVARMLHLGYPGGPEIERTAKKGNKEAVGFPRPMIHSKDSDFSFSGLKTAVFYEVRDKEFTDEYIADIAASFQEAVVETLVIKTKKAAEQRVPSSVLVVGGVSLNTSLRERIRDELSGHRVLFPEAQYTGDNAAMIALAGYIRYRRHGEDSINTLDIDPSLTLA